jgi:hypothetical protein
MTVKPALVVLLTLALFGEFRTSVDGFPSVGTDCLPAASRE